MALILQNIEKIVTLSKQERDLFLSKIEVKHYKAKTVLLQAGEVCKHSYFVNSGIL
jgi:CRP-like cAMP-binding protein